jgi:hypothetical protein
MSAFSSIFIQEVDKMCKIHGMRNAIVVGYTDENPEYVNALVLFPGSTVLDKIGNASKEVEIVRVDFPNGESVQV